MDQFYLQAVMAIADRWKLLLGVVVLAGAGSAAFEAFRPPAYEAETVLEIANAIFGERNTFAELEGLGASKYAVSSSFANRIAVLEGPTVLQDLLQSTSVIGELYEKLKGQNVFEEQAPEPRDFENWLTAEANVVDQTTRPVTYSPVIFLRSEGRTEEEARAIVDTWAQLAIELVQRAARLRVEPITEILKILETEKKETLDAVVSELTALDSKSGGAGSEVELELVLRQLIEADPAALTNVETLNDAALQDRIDRLKSTRDELQRRAAVYREKRVRLEIREQVARENYVDVATNLVQVETAGRIALSKDAQGKYSVGLNLLTDHAYAREKRGVFGKKERVVAVTFVAAVLAAACIVVVDVALPYLRAKNAKF
ncbi:MAG: hypothetical protein AAB353_10360 [Candidatus Hydrogenedentota bacterium]